MKEAYFFINGFLDSIDDENNEEYDNIKLDNQYRYNILNFGVRKEFESCKSGAIWDLNYDVFGIENIIPNSFIAIFKIEIDDEYYNSINDACAFSDDYDVWQTIIENQDKLFYSVRYDENKKEYENFIKFNNLSFEI